MNLQELVNDILVTCPHCNEHVIIEKLNCCIFRHGILKITGEQIDPHTNKVMCEFYSENFLIFGCGKPFQIVKNEKDEFIAITCDYI
jgi:hypothetical protein